VQNTAVEIKGLTKAFGANNVLRGIDLELYHGQVTALMGANGAGKSTLVKVLGRAMSEINLDIPEAGAPIMQIENLALRPDSQPFSRTCAMAKWWRSPNWVLFASTRATILARFRGGISKK